MIKINKANSEIGIIVPIRDNNGREIPVEKYEKVFLTVAGGFTSTKSRGGWLSASGKTYYNESVTIVTSFDDSKQPKALWGLAFNIKALFVAGELSVCFILNNQKYFIDNTSDSIEEIVAALEELM